MTNFDFLRTEKDPKELQWFFNSREIYVADFEEADDFYKSLAACETPQAMAEVLVSTNILVGGICGLDTEDALEWLSEEYKYKDPAEEAKSEFGNRMTFRERVRKARRLSRLILAGNEKAREDVDELARLTLEMSRPIMAFMDAVDENESVLTFCKQLEKEREVE